MCPWIQSSMWFWPRFDILCELIIRVVCRIKPDHSEYAKVRLYPKNGGREGGRGTAGECIIGTECAYKGIVETSNLSDNSGMTGGQYV